MEIAIFNVVAFAPTDDGKFRIVVHHVAGTNSEDAQRRILKKMPPSTCRDVASSALTRGTHFFRRLQSGSTTLDGASLSLTQRN
jgi:hypothetical protein